MKGLCFTTEQGNYTFLATNWIHFDQFKKINWCLAYFIYNRFILLATYLAKFNFIWIILTWYALILN